MQHPSTHSDHSEPTVSEEFARTMRLAEIPQDVWEDLYAAVQSILPQVDENPGSSYVDLLSSPGPVWEDVLPDISSTPMELETLRDLTNDPWPTDESIWADLARAYGESPSPTEGSPSSQEDADGVALTDDAFFDYFSVGGSDDNPDILTQDSKPQAQGRSRAKHNRTYTSLFRAIPEGMVYEFGRLVDLTCEADVVDYLTHLDSWLLSLRKPKAAPDCRRIALSFVGRTPHRKIALVLLAKKGNPMARLLLLSIKGTMPDDSYQAFSLAQAQGVSDILGVAAAFAGALLVYKTYQLDAKIQPILEGASRVTAAADATVSAADKVVQWIKDCYSSLKAKIVSLIDGPIRLLIKGLLLITTVVASGEYIRSIFPALFSPLTSVVLATFKLATPSWWKLEAQGSSFSESFGRYCYTGIFGSRGYQAFARTLNSSATGFCKIVSVGRGIEWLYRNLRYWLALALESWTGDAHPSTSLEEDIEKFRREVVSMDAESATQTMSDISSPDYALRIQDLEVFYTKTMNRIQHDRNEVRPVFIGLFNTGRAIFDKMRSRQRQAAASGVPRPCPVWVYIHGDAGVGKSTISDAIVECVYNKLSSQGVKRCPGKFQVYDRYAHTTDLYHDSYRKQFAITIDDFLTDKDPSSRSEAAKFMLNLISCSPYALLSATPEMKGALWVDSPLVVTTSNLSPSNHFKTENLGLTDVHAFSDRRAVSVRQLGPVSGEGSWDKPLFRLDQEPGRSLTMDGPVTDISFRQLVSLVSALVKRRLEEPPFSALDMEVPDFEGSYTAPRGAVIDQFFDVPLETLPPDEKEKEKIDAHGSFLDNVDAAVTVFRSILLDNEARALASLPEWIRERVRKISPHRFHLQPHLYESKTHWGHRVGILSGEKETDDRALTEAWVAVRDLVPLSVLSTAAIAMVSLGAVVGWSLMKTFLPSSASQPVGQSEGDFYRSRPKRLPPRKLSRATVRSQRWKAARPEGHGLPRTGGPYAQGLALEISRHSQILSAYHTTKSHLEVEKEGIPPDCSSWCLVVAGNIAILPAHTLHVSDNPIDDPLICLDRSIKYWTRWSKIVRYRELGGDLLLAELPGFTKLTSIVKHFATTFDRDQLSYHVVPEEATLVPTREAAGHPTNVKETVDIPGYGKFDVDVRFDHVRAVKGMCGTAYVTGDDKIFAIHMAGITGRDRGYGVMVFRQDIEDFCQVIETPLPDLLEGQCIAGAHTMGYLPASKASYLPDTSAIVRTDFDMTDFPFPSADYLPAKLKAERVDGVLHSPVANALRKLEDAVIAPPPPRMADFSDFVPDKFDPSFNRVCSIEDAIYGNSVLDPMDRHNSVGYRFKKLGFNRQTLFGDPELRTPHPLLRRAVEQIIDKWTKGVITPTVYEFFLKDELRPRAKVESYNTRPISPDCIENLIALRMVFGYLIESLMADPTGCAVALAINPHSAQWTSLWKRLGEGHRRPIAGDFKTYDFTIGNFPLEEFKDFCVMAMPGVSPVLIRAAIDSAFSGWHVCGRLVFQRLCGTASGSLLTAIFNTFVNWWIHKSAFLSLYPDGDFRSVGFSAVGDDSVGGVPDDYPLYTMEYVGQWVKLNMGMTYTNCSKDGTGEVPWEDITFLKRRFVPEDGRVLAPLATDSIYNIIAWSASDYHDPVVSQSIADSVLLETYHHGKLAYDAMLAWYRSESVRLGLPLLLRSYDMVHRERLPHYFPHRAG